MCIQWTCVLYSVVITGQCNPPISKYSNPCNEFKSVWSMSSKFVNPICLQKKIQTLDLEMKTLLGYSSENKEAHGIGLSLFHGLVEQYNNQHLLNVCTYSTFNCYTILTQSMNQYNKHDTQQFEQNILHVIKIF